jgi:hypothetical protein
MARPKLTVVEVEFKEHVRHNIPKILNADRRDWTAIADEEGGVLILRTKGPELPDGGPAFRIPLADCRYYRCSGAKAADEPTDPK